MIWCVEDDPGIRDIEVYALSSMLFEAKGFEDGTSFWEALKTETPDLVILDVMLPGIDGIELLKMMRSSREFENIPVIMATAKGSEYDKVQSLDLGADDYLVKPFGIMELVAIDGRRLSLTYKEYELLHLFLSNPGVAFTREQLLSSIWNTDFMGESRTVDMHIRTLRQKLGKYGAAIETLRNVGYRLEAGYDK